MRQLIFLLLLLSLQHAQATNYYFSALSGDDARTAAIAGNPATPWKSVNKLNAFFGSLNAGDTVFFKRGEIFVGGIVATKSGASGKPIVFAAYGEGGPPVISGFTTLQNWVHTGGGIYETSVAGNLGSINSLVINGQMKPLGRYPNEQSANKGYLRFETSVKNTRITDLQLSAAPNWTGAEVVIRKNRWVVDRNRITNHTGNNIDYISGSHYNADPNFGYFFQNHRATLDLFGEWYYDVGTRKIGIFLGSINPSTVKVNVSTIATLLTINNQHYLKFINLTFEGSNGNSHLFNGASGISIFNCSISYAGTNAVSAKKTTDLTIDQSVISYTNSNALIIDNCQGTIIRNNIIKATGSFAGMGEGGAGTYEAMLVHGNNSLIEGNRIDSTGYIPITFNGNGVNIKNNVISNYAFIKDDGGAIYTYNGSGTPAINNNRKITGNIISNGIGAPAGTTDTISRHANGIYMDDKVNNVEITGNTVFNCGKYGLFVHNANNLLIKNNLLYNNQRQIGLVHDHLAPNDPVRNIRLTGNLLFSKRAVDVVAEYKSLKNDLALFGQFDSNYYCRPLDENLVINTSYAVNGKHTARAVDLAGWKAMYGKDPNSRSTPLTFKDYTVNSVSGSNKLVNGNFNSNASGLYAWSAAGNVVASWNNKNELDGGSLQVSFSNQTGSTNRASVIIAVGALTAQKTYVLKFSLKGSAENKSLQLFLRKSLAGYNDLSLRKNVMINPARTEHEIVFTATASESNASLVLDVEEQVAPLYLDNIQLHEASITWIETDKNIRFEYNASAGNKTVQLDGVYQDVYGQVYSSSIVIPAFSAVILLRAQGIPIPPPPPVPSCPLTGSILWERWEKVNGSLVVNIPVSLVPTETKNLPSFEFNNLGDNYATRTRGYICAPETGDYVFTIAGDDEVEFWLSTTADPVGKKRIAHIPGWTSFRQWNKYPSQKSAPVRLVKGQQYYVEALHKEAFGGDHLSVSWQLPSGLQETPIAGKHLSPFQGSIPGKTSQLINFPAITSKTFGDAAFALVASASSGLPISFKVLSGPATVSNNQVTLTGVGEVVVQASQIGNNQYLPATEVVRQFQVVSAPVVVGSCTAQGSLLAEFWLNTPGNNVRDIPQQQIPTSASNISLMEITNSSLTYATRLRGYLCAPETGNYQFMISGDDAGELWLSTDANPLNKVKLASFVSWTELRQFNKNAAQTSKLIPLKKGQTYYIEALHKQGGGGAHFTIGWKLPNGTVEAPMPGAAFSPFVINNTAARGSTGIEKNSLINANDLKVKQLIIYPNPVTANSVISFNALETGATNIGIFDLQGRRVQMLFKGFVGLPFSKNFSVPGNLGSGMYLVKVETATGTTVYKLLIN